MGMPVGPDCTPENIAAGRHCCRANSCTLPEQGTEENPGNPWWCGCEPDDPEP